MTNNLQKAKEILQSGNYTCVLYDGTNEYHSNQKGVRPLIDFLNSKTDFSGYSAADKVVGAGAAHLYVLLRIKCVWACVLSDAAKAVLESNNIKVYFEKHVPYIINRAGDSMCPIEACVSGITDSNAALVAIKKKLRELKVAKRPY